MTPAERQAVVQALETLQTAIREVQHAQSCGANWYTRGEKGLYMQVAMWCRKGSSAAQEALAIMRKEPEPTIQPAPEIPYSIWRQGFAAVRKWKEDRATGG